MDSQMNAFVLFLELLKASLHSFLVEKKTKCGYIEVCSGVQVQALKMAKITKIIVFVNDYFPSLVNYDLILMRLLFFSCFQDVVYALAHATGKTGRFTLIERWRTNERLLAPQEHPLKVSAVVKGCEIGFSNVAP